MSDELCGNLEMKAILIILLLVPTLTFSQVDKQLLLSETAKKLTGTWLLKNFEKDSISIEQKIVGERYMEITKICGRTVKTEAKDGLDVVKLSFDKFGRGGYQEFNKYQILGKKKGDIVEILTCQPVPELKFKSGKIIIHMTYMAGEGEEQIIELTENRLILLSNISLRRTYEKLK
ncbi:MAG: hypothetical protein NTZ69_01185 [Bacteroidia bacterium]|nr:hypothetical protein [Bacteroidia bacterium]